MAFGDRKSERVDFEQGIRVYMMGIDGTWRRDCLMIDVSQTGARLSVEGSLEGLDLKEFFLLLSSTGLAYRRCRMVRLAGDQIGIEFLKQPAPKSRKTTPRETQGNRSDEDDCPMRVRGGLRARPRPELDTGSKIPPTARFAVMGLARGTAIRCSRSIL